ncbi:MAG: DUF86 domain-containing protein [Anaerolineales bacterium]|nr:DUF86 domain-containing protein [Anaerolineales bacterium]
MELETKKLIYDMSQAIELIRKFTNDVKFADYRADPMLRSAVERQFEIVGEALNRLKRVNPELMTGITEHQRIIHFRNVLAHGYDVVSDGIVWDILQNKLPLLREEIEKIRQILDMD